MLPLVASRSKYQSWLTAPSKVLTGCMDVLVAQSLNAPLMNIEAKVFGVWLATFSMVQVRFTGSRVIL